MSSLKAKPGQEEGKYTWLENLAFEVSPLLLVGGRVIVQATAPWANCFSLEFNFTALRARKGSRHLHFQSQERGQLHILKLNPV